MRSTLLRIAALCGAVLLSACKAEKAVEADRPLMVTVEDLREYGIEVDDPGSREAFRRVRYADGTLEVEYEFETPDAPDVPPLSLSVTAGFHRTVKDAKDSFLMERGALGIGIGSVSDVTLKQVPNFFRWGDESYFAHLVGPDGPGGMVFAARRGTRTYLFMAGGLYFDDVAEWASLIEPRLAYLESYDPLKRPAATRGGPAGYASGDSAGVRPPE